MTDRADFFALLPPQLLMGVGNDDLRPHGRCFGRLGLIEFDDVERYVV